jgi:hypothetical protein
MTLLFLMFLIAQVFLLINQRRTGKTLLLINLVFCLCMLLFHATDKLSIRL